MTDNVGGLTLRVAVGCPEGEYRRVRKLLTPGRVATLAAIHEQGEITVADLMKRTGIGRRALETSLNVFAELDLIDITLDPNPGHGKRRTVTSKLPAKHSALTIDILLHPVKTH